jgi:hypothetical protein
VTDERFQQIRDTLDTRLLVTEEERELLSYVDELRAEVARLTKERDGVRWLVTNLSKACGGTPLPWDAEPK